MLLRFSNILKIIFTVYNFWTPKTTQNHHSSLKEVWHKLNLLLLFKIHATVFDKTVSYFCHILEYFWGHVQFWRCFGLKKHSEIVTDPLIGLFRVYIKISNKRISSDDLWKFSNSLKVMFSFHDYFFCLKYMSAFSTNLLFIYLIVNFEVLFFF